MAGRHPPTGERVFHVSDRADIRCFEPRPSRNGDSLVWTVSGERLPNYVLPRATPRVTWYATSTTSRADQARFFCGADRVVAVESRWWQRLLAARLYIYHFEPAPFELHDAIAGYHVARRPVEPVACTRIDDVFGWMANEGVELRPLPTLWPLREAVAVSTLGFSIIRFRNAAPPPKGFVSAFEVTR